jgi:hypothetical protein
MRSSISIAVALLAWFSLPLVAQTVTKASPSPVQIQAGGTAVRLTLEGTNLGLVSAVRVVAGGAGSTTVTGTVATIRSRTTASLISDLTAASTVTPGTYQLELTIGTQRIIAPVSVTVLRPALQPLEEPTITPTAVSGVAVPSPSVTGASPTSVALRVGGPVQTVVLMGSLLTDITGARTERNGTRVYGIKVELQASTDPTRRAIRLSAPAGATPPLGVPIDLVLEYRIGIAPASLRTPVQITASPPPNVDLIMSSCTIEMVRNTSLNRDELVARATIRNNGSEPAAFQTDQVVASATRTTPVGMYDAPYAGQFRAPGGGQYFPPGASANFSVTFVLPKTSGSLEMAWTADPADVVLESQPTNNNRTCSYSHTAPTPSAPIFDLAITGISTQPYSGPPQTSFVFTFVVKNVGTVNTSTTSENVEVRCLIDNGRFTGDTFYLPHLAPNESVTKVIKTTWSFIPGNKVLECAVDPNQRLTESTRNNNYRSLVFTVTSGVEARTP